MTLTRTVTLACLLTACSSLKTGPSKSYEVQIPASGKPHWLRLDIPVGQDVRLEPGGKQTVSGNITTNLAELAPLIDSQGDRSTVAQKLPAGTRPPSGFVNRWDLKLGPTPLHLEIDAGVAAGKLQLGGLRLLSFDLEAGVQCPAITFDRPNLADMSQLRVQGGVGEFRLSGLSYANTRNLEVEGGVGATRLDFGGPLRQKAQGHISGGVGEISLTFPAHTQARLRVSKGIGKINATGFDENHSVYQTPGYNPKKPHWDLGIEVGVGTVTVTHQK